MKRLTDHLRILLLRMGLSFVMLFLTQIYYLIVNYSHFEPGDAGLWWGMMVFLVSAVCFINAPLLVAELLPHPWRLKWWYRKSLQLLFVFTNALGLAANLADAHFFKYTLKRSTADVLDLMGRDAGMVRLIPSLLRDYWPAVITLVLMVAALVWVDKKFRLRFQARERYTLAFVFRHTILFIIIFTSAVTISRGGFRLKPIAPISANGYTVPANVPLVLNTPFTVIRTLGSGMFNIPAFMTNEEAQEEFSFINDINGIPQTQKPNFVVLILESFGNEFAGRMTPNSPTPFLDSLLRLSLVPDVGLANGKRSIDALPAIISGIPCLMNSPFVSSVYASNPVESVPKKLKSLGYFSSFFHGGNNGTMGFDDFTEAAGFDRYVGLNEYPRPEDSDGTWGIYDEPFLLFSGEEINRQETPFFSCIFTLSSHHPYSVPEHLDKKIPKDLTPVERSIRYADYSLSQFFTEASKKEWFENTIFILTADHSPASNHAFYRNDAGRYLVPISFYSPNDTLLPKSINQMVQHADLPSAILHLAGYSGTLFSVGKNPFVPADNHFSPCFANEIFQVNDGRFLYRFDGEKSIGLFDWTVDSLLENNLLETDRAKAAVFEKKTKALLTLFGHALETNQMTAK